MQKMTAGTTAVRFPHLQGATGGKFGVEGGSSSVKPARRRRSTLGNPGAVTVSWAVGPLVGGRWPGVVYRGVKGGVPKPLQDLYPHNPGARRVRTASMPVVSIARRPAQKAVSARLLVRRLR
jgi:hypothetical protein